MAQTSVGIGTLGGAGVSLSSYGDALYYGPSQAYEANRRGLETLLGGNDAAAETIFRDTLTRYPDNPDTIYYLGLTLIYLEKRKEGYAMLRTFRDPHRYRVTQAVHWWADYLEKKPDLTPKKIHETLNKNRVDAMNRDSRERWERTRTW